MKLGTFILISLMAIPAFAGPDTPEEFIRETSEYLKQIVKTNIADRRIWSEVDSVVLTMGWTSSDHVKLFSAQTFDARI